MAAVDSYMLKRDKIDSLLASIKAKVDRHQDSVDPEHVNWAHVGDLGHIANELANIDAFLR